MRFKIFKTEIYVSFLFAAFILIMLLFDKTGLLIPTLFASLIHETGHLFAMWCLDCQPRKIRLIPASVQIVRSFCFKRNGEIKIAIMGPICNLVLFFVLFLNFLIFKNEGVLTFGILNLVIGVFNLLPVSGLDGGVILEGILEKKTDPYKAKSYVRLLTVFLSFVFFVLGVYLWVSESLNISFFIVAVYLLLSAIIRC